jgi:DNA (cytosine-5)-methyltransferase 1
VRILDLFCGAGGAAMGYHRAGFDVVGVDIVDQPHYPFEFHQGDAMTWPLEDFDAIHASLPCQAYTRTNHYKRLDHPELIDATRDRLTAYGRPWVIENVPGAPMRSPIVLCGSAFGLPIIRHRLFECSEWVLIPSSCGSQSSTQVTGHGDGYYPYGRKKWRKNWRLHVVPAVWPWMTFDESCQAIPPAYTEHIGRQMMAAMTKDEAA